MLNFHFITNSLATHFKILSPNTILINTNQKMRESFKTMTEDETITTKSSLQVMEYIIDFKNLRIRDLNNIPQLPNKLGELLAFDVFIVNSDRFLYMTRLIDNKMFEDDPEYNKIESWDYPMVNLGNIDNGNLWSIEAFPNYVNVKDFYRYKKLIENEINLPSSYLLDRILDTTMEYFEL